MSRTHSHVPYSVVKAEREEEELNPLSPKTYHSHLEMATLSTDEASIERAKSAMESIGHSVTTVEKDLYYFSYPDLYSSGISKIEYPDFSPRIKDLSSDAIYPFLNVESPYLSEALVPLELKTHNGSGYLATYPLFRSFCSRKHKDEILSLGRQYGYGFDPEMVDKVHTLANLRKNLKSVTVIYGDRQWERKPFYRGSYCDSYFDAEKYSPNFQHPRQNGARKSSRSELHSAAIAYNSGCDLEELEDLDAQEYERQREASIDSWYY